MSVTKTCRASPPLGSIITSVVFQVAGKLASRKHVLYIPCIWGPTCCQQAFRSRTVIWSVPGEVLPTRMLLYSVSSPVT